MNIKFKYDNDRVIHVVFHHVLLTVYRSMKSRPIVNLFPYSLEILCKSVMFVCVMF